MRYTPDGTSAADVIEKKLFELDGLIQSHTDGITVYEALAADSRADLAAAQKVRDELAEVLETVKAKPADTGARDAAWQVEQSLRGVALTQEQADRIVAAARARLAFTRPA